MKGHLRHIVILLPVLSALVLLYACTREAILTAEQAAVADGVFLDFSLSFDQPAASSTKMTAGVTQIDQTEASFRGIEEIFAIPFDRRGLIVLGDARFSRNLDLPQKGLPANTFGASALEGDYTGLVRDNHSHLYKDVYLKKGLASVLVYGKALDESVSVSPDSVAFKRRNGVLIKHGLEAAATTSDISFTLEPMLNSSAETQIGSAVNGLLNYLTDIANTYVSVVTYPRNSNTSNGTTYYYFNDPASYSNYADLSKLFTDFLTNDGNAFSGSSSAIEDMLTTLYNRLYPLTSDTSQYLLYYQSRKTSQSRYYYIQELAEALRSAINNSTYVTLSGSGANVTVTLKSAYAGIPDSYGVPAGALAILWNGTRFSRVTDAGAALAPAGSYCFPPSLWYYANSTIRCSDDADIAQQYKQENTTWEAIFDQYTYSSSVRGGATSAAVKDPMRYGVGMLRIVMNQAKSEGGTYNLLDANSDPVRVDNANFPLTGVIVGEQRTQHFNFTPTTEEAKYIYDSDVTGAYISYSQESSPVQTLVLETHPEEDVHYALEFRNDSSAEFKGADGIIKPGSRFYLIGELEWASATPPAGIRSIFLKHHITEVRVTMKGLAKAYNVVPELRDPQLQIGIEAVMDWVQVTPAEIPMY